MSTGSQLLVLSKGSSNTLPLKQPFATTSSEIPSFARALLPAEKVYMSESLFWIKVWNKFLFCRFSCSVELLNSHEIIWRCFSSPFFHALRQCKWSAFEEAKNTSFSSYRHFYYLSKLTFGNQLFTFSSCFPRRHLENSGWARFKNA